eukprot:3244891-Prymnesium_polylepis.1
MFSGTLAALQRGSTTSVGRLMGRAIVEQRAASPIVQAALRWRWRRHGRAANEAGARAAVVIQAAARRRSRSQEFLELRARLR